MVYAGVEALPRFSPGMKNILASVSCNIEPLSEQAFDLVETEKSNTRQMKAVGFILRISIVLFWSQLVPLRCRRPTLHQPLLVHQNCRVALLLLSMRKALLSHLGHRQ